MTKKRAIKDFINDLVLYVLKMKKKGDTVFEYFPDNDYNRIRDIVGFSVVQVISLSSITLHLNDISKTAYIDVFTCGNIDVEKVIDCIIKFLLIFSTCFACFPSFIFDINDFDNEILL